MGGGWGERERVAGQETSSADEVIGLKIKRWRHLKPIPVNELSGARGKGGDRRGQGGGRRAGLRARPPIPRPPKPGARLRASFRQRGEGSGHVPFQSSATPRQVPQAPLGGAGAARRGGPRGLLLPARRSPPGSRPQIPAGVLAPAARLQRCTPTVTCSRSHSKWKSWDLNNMHYTSNQHQDHGGLVSYDKGLKLYSRWLEAK